MFRTTRARSRGQLTPYLSTVEAGFAGFGRDSVAGLAMWLKADSLTLTAGSGISTWFDDSGNGINATQATSASQPTFQPSVRNGFPVVRFNSSLAQFFTFPSNAFTALTAATMFVVIKTVSDPPSSDIGSGFGQFGSAPDATHFPFTDGTIYDDFGTTIRKTTVNPTTALNQFNIYSVVSAPSSWTSLLNEVQLFTTATNTVGWTSTPNLGFDTATNSIYLNADIGEMMIYNNALSTTDRQKVAAYLKMKWNTP